MKYTERDSRICFAVVLFGSTAPPLLTSAWTGNLNLPLAKEDGNKKALVSSNIRCIKLASEPPQEKLERCVKVLNSSWEKETNIHFQTPEETRLMSLTKEQIRSNIFIVNTSQNPTENGMVQISSVLYLVFGDNTPTHMEQHLFLILLRKKKLES